MKELDFAKKIRGLCGTAYLVGGGRFKSGGTAVAQNVTKFLVCSPRFEKNFFKDLL